MPVTMENHNQPWVESDPTPKPFTRLGPDTIQVREGGGILSFFGLPFLAAGVFLLLAGLGVIPFSNENEIPGWGHALFMVMGLAFTTVGSVLVFGRSWTIIDRSAGSITKSKGLLVPMRQDQLSLHDHNRVELRFEKGDSDSPDTYPICLTGSGGRTLKIISGSDFAASFRQAACLAYFLQFPLEDATGGHLRTLTPEELVSGGLSAFKDRAVRPRVGRPLTMRSTIDQSTGELQITIPCKPFRLIGVLPAVLGTIIWLYVSFDLVEFFDRSSTPTAVQNVFLLTLLVIMVGLPVLGVTRAALRACFGYSRLAAGREALTLSERSILRVRSRRLELSQIIDIDYQTVQGKRSAVLDEAIADVGGSQPGGGKFSPDSRLGRFLAWAGRFVTSDGIIIKSTQGWYTFGAGLPDDELTYLHQCIREAVR